MIKWYLTICKEFHLCSFRCPTSWCDDVSSRSRPTLSITFGHGHVQGMRLRPLRRNNNSGLSKSCVIHSFSVESVSDVNLPSDYENVWKETRCLEKDDKQIVMRQVTLNQVQLVSTSRRIVVIFVRKKIARIKIHKKITSRQNLQRKSRCTLNLLRSRTLQAWPTRQTDSLTSGKIAQLNLSLSSMWRFLLNHEF